MSHTHSVCARETWSRYREITKCLQGKIVAAAILLYGIVAENLYIYSLIQNQCVLEQIGRDHRMLKPPCPIFSHFYLFILKVVYVLNM